MTFQDRFTHTVYSTCTR